MTIARTKATGWSDDWDSLTGAEAAALDAQPEDAMDAVGGGPYSPSGALSVDSMAFDPIKDCTLTTPLERIGARGIISKVATGTCGEVLSTANDVDTTADLWYLTLETPPAPFAKITLNVDQVGMQEPLDGEVIKVVIDIVPGGSDSIIIEDQYAGDLAVVNNSVDFLTNKSHYATFVFDTTQWYMIEGMMA